ncbi:MAG: PAS-domain containing protein [Rhodospirillaceae bacterium]
MAQAIEEAVRTMVGTALWARVPTVWAKFLLIMIPIITGSTVTFAYLFLYSQRAELEHSLTAKVAAITEANAIALAASLWPLNAANTHDILSMMANNREIICIKVLDNQDNNTSTWPVDGCGPLQSGLALSRTISKEGKQLGKITAHYTDDNITLHLQSETIDAARFLLLQVLMTFVATLLAHRLTIGIPLGRLRDSMRLAEQKGSRKLVQWTGSDELGKVIAIYNRLLVKLAYEEVALRHSEERLGLAIAATHSSVWDLNLTTGQIWWSAELPANLGYGSDELTMSPETLERLIHPEDRSRVLSESQRHITGEAKSYCSTHRMLAKDGGFRWIEDKATAIRDHDGVALRLTGIIADVTERKQAELDLVHERSILQATLENVDQGITMFDNEPRLVTFNRRAAELLNVPLRLLTTHPTFAEIVTCQKERGEFAGADQPNQLVQLWHRLPTNNFIVKHRRPDGIVIEVVSNPLFQGGFVCTYTDITAQTRATEATLAAMLAAENAYAELKETQASLVQAEKMASLGLLVAGIAHEINTPVGIAFGCASHLAGRTQTMIEALEGGTLKKSDLLAYGEVATESSRLMSTNLNRAADLIRSFKQVAVDQASDELRHFDLGTYIDEVITSLGPHLRTTNHKILIECPANITIDGHPGALSQILTNLVMNALIHAFEAKPEGTMTITVKASSDTPDIDLSFSDDGKGIAEALHGKIFEPFFTTRRSSGGSGLGLHIVFNLVTQSLGGHISVTSAENQGATFHIRMPRRMTRKSAATGQPEREPESKP